MRILQLDGLRAIAVFLVLLTHHNLFGYGWIGVDLFFVLSGFLITGILRRTRNDPFYWRPFYIKRATRILPPMLLFLLLAAFVLHRISWIYALYVFFLANVAACLPAPLPIVNVLWSLAVEEHFYIFWPWFVKHFSRRRLVNVCLIILISSPILRLVATVCFRLFFGAHSLPISLVFFLTPFRLDGLAAGALLALFCETPSPALQMLSRWSLPTFLSLTAGFFALHAAAPAFDRDFGGLLFNSIGYSAVALIGFALISHLVLQPASWLARVFRFPALIFIGQISYGIYLYHVVARVGVLHTLRILQLPMTSVIVFCCDVLASIGFATLSFYLLEKPIIAWGHRRARSLRVPLAAQATTA